MKTIPAILCMGLLLAACNKSSSPSSINGTGIITANINGVNDTFKFSTTDTSLTSYGFPERSVQANDAASSRISIVLAELPSITTGFYNENGSDTESRLVLQTTAGQYVNNSSLSDPVIVDVTSLSSTSIHGNFHGVIYSTFNSDSLLFTNGKFDFTK